MPALVVRSFVFVEYLSQLCYRNGSGQRRNGISMRSSRRALPYRRTSQAMCNLYSLTKGQAAIRGLFSAKHDRTGNLPLFPAIFPDQLAPIVRNGPDGERELVMARWGMPGPPQFGGAPITNIRNVGSPHWRGWPGRLDGSTALAAARSR